jgi:hypothetical protein
MIFGSNCAFVLMLLQKLLATMLATEVDSCGTALGVQSGRFVNFHATNWINNHYSDSRTGPLSQKTESLYATELLDAGREAFLHVELRSFRVAILPGRNGVVRPA